MGLGLDNGFKARPAHEMDSHFPYETNKDAFHWQKEFNEPQNINKHVIHIVLNSMLTHATY